MVLKATQLADIIDIEPTELNNVCEITTISFFTTPPIFTRLGFSHGNNPKINFNYALDGPSVPASVLGGHDLDRSIGIGARSAQRQLIITKGTDKCRLDVGKRIVTCRLEVHSHQTTCRFGSAISSQRVPHSMCGKTILAEGCKTHFVKAMIAAVCFLGQCNKRSI